MLLRSALDTVPVLLADLAEVPMSSKVPIALLHVSKLFEDNVAGHNAPDVDGRYRATVHAAFAHVVMEVPVLTMFGLTAC